MSVGFAVPGARDAGDVAAFPGGIGLRRGRVHIEGAPGFGASPHAAALCLACMKRYPFIRSAAASVTIGRSWKGRRRRGCRSSAWDKEEGAGDRRLVVETALERTAGPPDIIYDQGDAGAEAVIRLFARDPQELIKKMEMIRPCTTN